MKAIIPFFVAIGFDDRPKPEPLLLIWAFLPASVILISWALIRWRKSLVGVAFLIAASAGWATFAQTRAAIAGLESMQQSHPEAVVVPLFPEYVAASWFAASVPVISVACFYFSERSRTRR